MSERVSRWVDSNEQQWLVCSGQKGWLTETGCYESSRSSRIWQVAKAKNIKKNKQQQSIKSPTSGNNQQLRGARTIENGKGIIKTEAQEQNHKQEAGGTGACGSKERVIRTEAAIDS